jgi:hypothetical protein
VDGIESNLRLSRRRDRRRDRAGRDSGLFHSLRRRRCLTANDTQEEEAKR